MRPSDFKLNSDYLTLANIENLTFTASIPSTTLPSSGLYSATFNFSCKNIPKVMTRSYMRCSNWSEPNLWGVGASGGNLLENGSDAFYERMFVATPTNGVIRLSVEIQGGVGKTIPAHEITVKVFRFKVPNVF